MYLKSKFTRITIAAALESSSECGMKTKEDGRRKVKRTHDTARTAVRKNEGSEKAVWQE